jgi:hypothetical protein
MLPVHLHEAEVTYVPLVAKPVFQLGNPAEYAVRALPVGLEDGVGSSVSCVDDAGATVPSESQQYA